MSENEFTPVSIEPMGVSDLKSLSAISKVSSDGRIGPIERADSLLGLASDILEAGESSKLFKVEVPSGYSLDDLVLSKKGDGSVRAVVRDSKNHLNGDVSLRPNALSPARIE